MDLISEEFVNVTIKIKKRYSDLILDQYKVQKEIPFKGRYFGAIFEEAIEKLDDEVKEKEGVKKETTKAASQKDSVISNLKNQVNRKEKSVQTWKWFSFSMIGLTFLIALFAISNKIRNDKDSLSSF